MSQLSYNVVVSDTQGNADNGVATSQDVVNPPIPTPGKFTLDLSQTAFNPATGRDQIVIGGPYQAAGNNATQFGSQSIDAIIHNMERRVRIHYEYFGGPNASADRSINLTAPLILNPGESIHCKGTWLFENDVKVGIRKWLYFLRGDGATTFVLFTDGQLGSMSLTTNNPASYDDPSKVKLIRYRITPDTLLQPHVDIDLEFWMTLNSKVGIPDGSLRVNIDGVEVFNEDAIITGKVSTGVKGDSYKPLTLFKMGQQASAIASQPFNEWRYLSNGLFIEKL